MTANIGGSPAYLLAGNISEAIAVLERARRLNERWGFPQYVTWLASCLGHAHVLTGRASDGLPLLEEGAKHDAVQFVQTYRAIWAVVRGEAYLLAGRVAEAEREAALALELARSRHERGYEAWALRLSGEIACRAGTPDAEVAELRYYEALALAEELGMRPLQAHCHLGLGKLYRQDGRREEARTELGAAVAMLRDLGMTFWLPEAESELAEASKSRSAEQIGC